MFKRRKQQLQQFRNECTALKGIICDNKSLKGVVRSTDLTQMNGDEIQSEEKEQLYA